jgi:hypothetical protein
LASAAAERTASAAEQAMLLPPALGPYGDLHADLPRFDAHLLRRHQHERGVHPGDVDRT